MRYIEKTKEPTEFLEWKNLENEDWTPDYNNIPTAVKEILHLSLIREQGFICCYCGKTITPSDSHIEHIKPQGDKKYHTLSLTHTNLLASCKRQSNKNEPLHCGKAKGEWYEEALFIDPTKPECENKFIFTFDGRISPRSAEDIAASKTIKKLALDLPILDNHRRKALSVLDDIIDDTDALESLASAYNRRNTNGQFEPFCFVLLSIIKVLIPHYADPS